ncbi:tRNA (adenosine(37)-N6)-threonylcarbamoyltransferase complex dimerization subunit type 1 TsaB [Algiphilus sp.]|uniref:tRNA (adenosine(37)-N6)-threonylcarbamoyltransferase complex dimerization subunit type 1 TsaB n=1 Tax=Algiphilus sp. TaxID=1872431 RepID=UPI0025C17D46|nr:tRNA (adenosine(37)-N6)-threonylcarbamoyltransferase complex dimerization subunit type 1 TsaB [Algiphilus sp.]MCK5770801.1 tRNA (adenosine(37)-N6)-threonylcarbamoyltransferase complex dimerization subunit type 1 TsaB [Algiphilus sp.]
MKLLAVDSATAQLAVGVCDGTGEWRRDLLDHTAHAGRLPAVVHEVLTEAGIAARDLDGLIAGIGPGSFAGLRTGLGFLQAMAWALRIPIVTVGSLECMAATLLGHAGTKLAVPVLDARMGAVYLGGYRGAEDAPECVAAPEELAADEVSARIAGIRDVPERGIALGGNGLLLDGADALRDRAWAGFTPGLFPTAAILLAIGRRRFASGAAVDVDALRPLYVRDRVALTAAERAAGATLGIGAART